MWKSVGPVELCVDCSIICVGHQTRIITAYNPCKKKKSGTTYQQQRRYYITKKKDLTCPRKIFQRDLIKHIITWRESGDRIILFMDHNKHVTNGPLGRELGDNNGLDLREAIIQHTGASPGATFFCGSKPIDACGSQETPISAMPVSCRLGTEYAIIVPLFSISRWTR